MKHANKKAFFMLKSKDDTVRKVKSKIADYFGLPVDKIFLKNSNGKILLSD